MNTSFMQRAAIGGLFMAVWNSMVGTQAYDDMWRKARTQRDGYARYEVNGRIAKWETTVGNSYGARWAVVFKDASLGTLSLTLFRTGTIRYMNWYPDQFSCVEEPEIHFDDDTFARIFEELRKAAAAYIKYYRFSVDQEKVFLSGIFAP